MQAPTENSSSDVEGCAELTQMEAQLNQSLPRLIDPATEFIQVRVNCETKTVVYTKKILEDAGLLASGWEQRKRRQHAQLHCNRQGLASVGGWIAIDNIYDRDMNLLVSLTSDPTACATAFDYTDQLKLSS